LIWKQELEEDESTSVDLGIKGGQEAKLSSRHNKEGPTNSTKSIPSLSADVVVEVLMPTGFSMRMDKKRSCA
jgi:hypothetical protein